MVVYIHGIGPKPAPDILKGEWDLALFGRGMGDLTRMAYWADILHDVKRPRGKSVREVAAAFDHGDPVGEALHAVGLDRDDRKARPFLERLMASLGQDIPAGGAVKKKVLPLPRVFREPLARAFLQFFLQDSAAYFFDKTVREKIKQRLVDAIPARGEPFVLVSHSQGTVAAFEVLSELRNRPDACLLVTLGSPLGLQEVEDQLAGRGFKLMVPAGVNGWQNFSDPLDPVALDHTLANDYAARGSVAVRDHLVMNRSLREVAEANPHSATGYLAHLDVRQVVHQAMQFDSAGRFVVARDVAERFAAITTRHPVLIEVLEPRYHAVDEDHADVERREAKQPEQLRTLEGRVTRLANEVRNVVRKHDNGDSANDAVKAASVQELRKFVAAHLTPAEIQDLGSRPTELHVYAVWRSTRKRKLLSRSHVPLSVDAARESYKADGRGIRWAVLDTGCRSNHPHFESEETVEDVLDCTTTAMRPVSVKGVRQQDADGHGTHVSGIIAGAGTDGGRVYSGLAPRAKLIVYKVLDDHGEGEDAWIIKAIDDILRRNQNQPSTMIHGVNLSLGGPFDATVYGCGYSPLCQELRELWRSGVVVCVAAGNEGQIAVSTTGGAYNLNTQLSIGDPANLEECIAVGSVHTDRPHFYGVSYFSSRGPTADGRKKPDVVAPGERICSCNSKFKRDGRGVAGLYREDSGTSMACPHVSGLLAAFLSVRREYIGRPDELKEVLLRTCTDINRDRYHQGHGVPNLMRMLLDA